MEISQLYTAELLASLITAPLLILIFLAIGRWFVRHLRIPLGARYRVACSALCVWLPLRVYQSVVEEQFAAHSKRPTDVLVDGAAAIPKPFLFPEELLQGLLALFILFSAFVAVKLVRKYFWDGWFERTQDAQAPKFLSDIGSACIIAFSVVLIATGVYHKDLSGLQFGSTVSVAVLGFASQDLLGNLLSGVALQIGSPFRKGDWLLLDGKRLQVREVNWRSTRMRSPDNVMVDVPNKSIASGTIINLSAPTTERASRLVVGFDYDATPESVKECLIRAASSADYVMSAPAPKALLKNFGDVAVRYEIVFWVEREEYVMEACDSVQSCIWHEARKANLKMSLPMGPLQFDPVQPEKKEQT
jgi:small-conductance mechanosensitive channel